MQKGAHTRTGEHDRRIEGGYKKEGSRGTQPIDLVEYALEQEEAQNEEQVRMRKTVVDVDKDEKEDVKGWYDSKTNEVLLYLPVNHSIEDDKYAIVANLQVLIG